MLKSCLKFEQGSSHPVWLESDTFPTSPTAIQSTFVALNPTQEALVIPDNSPLTETTKLMSDLEFTCVQQRLMAGIIDECVIAYTSQCSYWQAWLSRCQSNNSPLIKSIKCEPVSDSILHPMLRCKWMVDTTCNWCPYRGGEHNGGAQGISLWFTLSPLPVRIYVKCWNPDCRKKMNLAFANRRAILHSNIYTDPKTSAKIARLLDHAIANKPC